MTPDRRLNQIEPVLADVVQKVDRLIDSNGQILDVATRADGNAVLANKNAEIAARGVATLTTELRIGFQQVSDQFQEVNSQFQQVNSQFQEVNSQFQEVNGQFQQVNGRLDNAETNQSELRQEMQQGFEQVNQRFDQLITLIQERLS